MASYKVPKRVLFFADGEIPMTTSDTKVRDDELVALVRERLAPTRPHHQRRPMTPTTRSTHPTSTSTWACPWSRAS